MPAKKRYTKTCIVMLDPNQEKILKKFAELRDTSISKVVRTAIVNLIEAESTYFEEKDILDEIRRMK